MIYNSNRIMNNYIAESFYSEGNRMINNVFNSSINVFNETISFKGIKEKVINFFKWLIDKIKQASLRIYNFIKKMIDNFKNKKYNNSKVEDNNSKVEDNNSKVEDKEYENEFIEIDIVDAYKVKDTLLYYIKSISSAIIDNLINNKNIINKDGASFIKSIIDRSIKNGYISSQDSDICNHYLDNAYDSITDYRFYIPELLSHYIKTIDRYSSSEDYLLAMRNYFSIFNDDDSIKEEYKKHLKIKRNEANDIIKKIKDETIDISNMINKDINTNYQEWNKTINTIQSTVSIIADAVDKLEKNIDEKENITNSSKSLIREIMELTNNIMNFGNEINNINANNVAKIIKNTEKICDKIGINSKNESYIDYAKNIFNEINFI